MSGMELAVIGAGIGAIASPRDPIRGAILGGTLGYAGGAAAGAGAGASGYAAAVPGLTATGPGSQAAMLAAQTGEFGLGGLASTAAAGSAPGSLASGFWNTVNRGTMLGSSPAEPLTRREKMSMAAQSLRGMNQEQTPVAGPNTFRGSKTIASTEPILSLLATAQPRRRQPMSLL